MDKIRIDFFDILGYLIPGSALLMVLWIAADVQVQSIWEAFDSLHKIDQRAILLGVFMAYIAGFVLHALGNLLYDLYKHKKIRKYAKTGVQSDWALIREYGSKHVGILERWYALRALSQNLAAVCVVGVSVCILKHALYGYYEWSVVALGALALAWVLLKRAEIFHHYLNDDIEAILGLGLDKKSKS